MNFVFKSKISSIGPYLFLDLSFWVPAFGLWAIYLFIKTTWYVMALSILASFYGLWHTVGSLNVAFTRVIISDLYLEIVKLRFFGGIRRIYWTDVDRIQILEKFRGYLPPARVDRLVIFFSKGVGIVGAVNSNAWSEEDEKTFLRILENMSIEHGFCIHIGTTRW